MGFLTGVNIDTEKLDLIMNGLGQQGLKLAAALDTNYLEGVARDVIEIFKRQRN